MARETGMKRGHRYEILELETMSFGTWSFDSVLASMFVEGPRGATIVLTDPADALRGVLDLRQWGREFCPDFPDPCPARVYLRRVKYDLWVPDNEGGFLRSQWYEHPFEQDTWLDGAMRLRTRAQAMFEGFALNFLVDSRRFTGQRAVQFVC